MRYRNLITGRVLERPAGPDRWLEASPAWELVDDEPAPAAEDDNDERNSDQ